MSIINLNQVILNVGGNCLLQTVNWQIEPQDKIALVGRNGAGKSSLLKLLVGELVPDSGQITRMNGLRINILSQEVAFAAEETVYHFLVKGLGQAGKVLADYYRLLLGNDFEALMICQQQMDELGAWDLLPKIDMLVTRLGINPAAMLSQLSGGMRRRVSLASALTAAPDLLILDEPTNHLDLQTIEWLENYLKNYAGAVVVVTHDRSFLSNLATRIVEIDRGKLYFYTGDYERYLDDRDTRLSVEKKHHALFDKRLDAEETWIRSGIKARRTRNEGRVSALLDMRQAYKNRRQDLGKIQSLALDVQRSGHVVIKANKVSFAHQAQTVVNNFSLILTRGDKLGIIGPNGCGKTTLLKLLLKELVPLTGTVKQGAQLQIAYFDQLRAQLDEQETVMNSVADGAEYVTINGKEKHIASYLRDFLFSSDRFNQTVAHLSGGERNRLLLARLFAKPVNLLVMDEPTNDLDIETLELLENMLVNYNATLLLISHDRMFVNNVVTSLLVYEEQGTFNEYVGDYDDYYRVRAQKEQAAVAKIAIKKKHAATKIATNKLAYKEQQELSQLPAAIEQLEQVIVAMQATMADSAFYQQSAQIIGQHNQQLAQQEKQLAHYYQRWEQLERKH